MTRIFLGTDPATQEREELQLSRMAITIAGSRMGKGACQIIPSLRIWDSSAIIVDPKGEAVRETIRQRENMGQEIAIIDPMRLVDNAEFRPYRKSFNPLDRVRSGGAGFRDIQMIADGLVMVSGRENDPHWNESALNTIAGCIAYLVEDDEHVDPHLGLLRPMLRALQDANRRAGLLERMAKCQMYGGLAADVAAHLSSGTDEVNSVLSSVGRHLRFLGDIDIVRALFPASDPAHALDLNTLRDGNLTLYVVIDPSSMTLHGRFMRLFVRLALSAMMETEFIDGKSANAPCLFVLDEFFSLGKISDIQKAAGLMPGYGVHLWPILQDWGQLVDLYDEHGAQTFLANADAVSVFGISDPATLNQVSSWFGDCTVDHITSDALELAKKVEGSEAWRKLGSQSDLWGEYIQNQDLAVRMALLQSRIGRPHKTPSEIQHHIAKGFERDSEGQEIDPVARRMYVLLRNGVIGDLVPTPHFRMS